MVLHSFAFTVEVLAAHLLLHFDASVLVELLALEWLFQWVILMTRLDLILSLLFLSVL